MRSPFQIAAIVAGLAVSDVLAEQDLEQDFEEYVLGAEKPYAFKLTIAPAGGYNSNVIQLGDGLPLPNGFSRQDAGFFEFDAAATLDWKSPKVVSISATAVPEHQITVGYEYKSDFYEGISGFDLATHSWSGKYTHILDGRWSYKIESKDSYATFDGHTYGNKFSVTPALDFELADDKSHIAEKLTAELALPFLRNDIYVPVTIPPRNMDANNYGVDVSLTFVPKGHVKTILKIDYAHLRNEADGSDYDYDKNRLQISAETRFSEQTTNRWYNLKATLKYLHDFDSYDHPNSHAGPGGFHFRRRDSKDDFAPGFSYDFATYLDGTPKFAINAQYHYVRDNSNVAFFNYTQHTVQAGCTYTFDDLKWK